MTASGEASSGDHLTVKAQLTPSTHRRTESSYSRNVSVIEMYNGESPVTMVSPEPGQHHRHTSSDLGSIDIDESIMRGLDELHFHALDNDTTIFARGLDENIDNSPVQHIERVTKESIPALVKSNFDIYGFKKWSNHNKITKQSYNAWFKEYAQYLVKRKSKWLDIMRSNGLSVDDTSDLQLVTVSGSSSDYLHNKFEHSKVPTRFPPKSDKVKKMIRRGIPPEWRGQAWFFYAGGYEKLNKNVGIYQQIVRDTQDVTSKDTEVIERDLNRTFPDNIYFNSNLIGLQNGDVDPGNSTPVVDQRAPETAMIKALRRVLVAFAHYQPQIGYCQSLNFLAGLLLLFMDEERAFWMLVILTERIIPKVHSATLEGVHTDQGVLMLCVKEYIPSLWSILGKNFDGVTLSEDKILTRLPPVTLVTSSWFMSVFVGVLPIESVLRVWDILWYEGSKSIFRMSLTILNMCLEKEEFDRSTKKTQNDATVPEMEQIELFQFIQNYPKTILDPNELTDNCFKKIGGYGFGSLSQDEINNCREFVSKQRAKLTNKRGSGIATELTQEERETLVDTLGDESIHDVYGFHRGIMSGVVWNRNISNRMKMKFTRKVSR